MDPDQLLALGNSAAVVGAALTLIGAGIALLLRVGWLREPPRRSLSIPDHEAQEVEVWQARQALLALLDRETDAREAWTLAQAISRLPVAAEDRARTRRALLPLLDRETDLKTAQELAETIKQLDPTGEDLARVNQALRTRGTGPAPMARPATLSALMFPGPEDADHALATLGDLQRRHLITVHDAAVVSWPSDKKKPKTHQAHNLVGAGALGGAFWGMLFGLIFFVPFLGAAIGAGIGAISGSLMDVGIDDKFIEQVGAKVTPGTSALFVLASGAAPDRVVYAFPDQKVEIVTTNLSKDQEERLRATFGDVSTTSS